MTMRSRGARATVRRASERRETGCDSGRGGVPYGTHPVREGVQLELQVVAHEGGEPFGAHGLSRGEGGAGQANGHITMS